MEIYTQHLVLRDLRDSDYPAIREFESMPETHHFEKVNVPEEKATRDELEAALNWAKEIPRTHYKLGVTIRPHNIVRGRVSLSLGNAELDQWEIGWVIHPEVWSQGIASEAAEATLAFAFRELHARRVVAYCNALNTASYRVMEKIGMTRESLRKGARWWNGAWVDEYVYAVTDKDWKMDK